MKEIIEIFLNQGFLLNPDLAKNLEKLNYKEFLDSIKSQKERPLVLNEDIKRILDNKKELININWQEFDKSNVLYQKNKEKNIYKTFLKILNQDFTNEINIIKESIKPEEIIEYENGDNSNLIILKNYDDLKKERSVETFTKYFKSRYNSLKNILINRQELQNTISINRLYNKTEPEKIAVIGLVNDKKTTKNGNILISLEDPTGLINIVVNKNKEIFEEANDILLDEVIGVTGVIGDRIIFVNEIYYPDIPANNPLKKSNKDEYVVFTSDMQVGNKLFYEKSFLKFIDWLNLKYGDEKQKEIAKKVKYLFIPGDIVEGVGVYPGQEEDLSIQDLYKQFDKFTEYIGKIRGDIKIIITPGNHDAIQIAEPQPAFDKKLVSNLFDLPNVYFATNPSLINIGSTKDFSGFNLLIYHGFSFPYIAENVESIRKAGRIERPDLIMKYQLQRRHLAPSHSSTLYLPSAKEDALVIEKIPDFFISGHLHKTIVANYKGITMANCSCWIGRTEDQERRGIEPDPCKVILVNLKNRDIKILNFKENE
jgi:DNA polymerase II small subunit